MQLTAEAEISRVSQISQARPAPCSGPPHTRARAHARAHFALPCFALQATALSASTKKIEALEARLARKGTGALRRRYYGKATWVCGTSQDARCLLLCMRRMLHGACDLLLVARCMERHALPCATSHACIAHFLMQWPNPNVRTPRWRR